MELANEELQKLKEVKTEIDKNGFSSAPLIDDQEKKDIESDLKKEAEQFDFEENSFDFNDIGNVNKTKKEKVEIESYGSIAKVNIDFDKLDSDLTEMQYNEIVNAMDKISQTNSNKKIRQAISTIEDYGDKALKVVFRMARKLKIRNKKRNEKIAANLVGNLCLRSLKGRNLIIALLKEAKTEQHLKLAALAAGHVMEEQAVPYLAEHLNNCSDKQLFRIVFEALLKTRSAEAIEPILEVIANLSPSEKDKIEIIQARTSEFKKFGRQAIPTVFEFYEDAERYNSKKIFGEILVSFGDQVTDFLKEKLEEEANNKDYNMFYSICQNLGHMKNNEELAAEILVDFYHRFPRYKKPILKGLSYIKDKQINQKQLKPIFINELKENNSPAIIEECLNALAYLRDDSVKSIIEPFKKDKRGKVYLYALLALSRHGDREALNDLMKYLVNGNNAEQEAVEKMLHKFKYSDQIYIAKQALDMNVKKSFQIISALRNPRRIPNEIGDILLKLLKSTEAIPLRIEIYKLIAKHANTDSELLPDEILYTARDAVSDAKEKRVLNDIIANLDNKAISRPERA